MDNRLLNINGKGKELLQMALVLALKQSGFHAYAGWKVDPVKGLVLLWHKDDKANSFITPLSGEAVSEQVWHWLQDHGAPNDDALEQWERNIDHDGSNSVGWRVYCEDWGHVGGHSYAVAAVKPIYLWHGK